MKIDEFYSNKKLQKNKMSIWEKPVLPLVKRNKRILEIGSGSGHFTGIIKKLGNNVSGIDISKANVKKQKEAGLDSYCIDIEKDKLPFPDNSFDQIIMLEVIEHLFDPYYALKEIRRVLKKEGEFIISTHNVLNWFMRILYLFGEVNITCDISKEGMGEHIRLYSHKILNKVLRKSGFRVTHIESWFKLPILGYYIKPKIMKSLLSQHILMRCKKK